MPKKKEAVELPVTRQTFSFQYSKGGEVKTEEKNIQEHSFNGEGDNITFFVRKGGTVPNDVDKSIPSPKKPTLAKKLTDEEFLELAKAIDNKRPEQIRSSHKNWAADGFRLHFLDAESNKCKCKFCKNASEGKYPASPDWIQLIPKDERFKGSFTINRDDMILAMNTCRIYAREGSNVVRFYIKDSDVIFQAESEETGHSENTMTIENGYSKTGNDLNIAFNVDFVIDAIRGMREKITVKYSVSNAPAIFTDGKRNALLMPMHLG